MLAKFIIAASTGEQPTILDTDLDYCDFCLSR